MAQRTNKLIDKVKLACLLRIADALHLDSRRAPRFARALVNPGGISDVHWTFQERLAKPHVELDAIVFTGRTGFQSRGHGGLVACLRHPDRCRP